MPFHKFPSRTAVGGVRYYFTDFELATSDQSSALGFVGQVRAPEESETVPYDPYKLDIYVLGKTYHHLMMEVSTIQDCISGMGHHSFSGCRT